MSKLDAATLVLKVESVIFGCFVDDGAIRSFDFVWKINSVDKLEIKTVDCYRVGSTNYHTVLNTEYADCTKVN